MWQKTGGAEGDAGARCRAGVLSPLRWDRAGLLDPSADSEHNSLMQFSVSYLRFGARFRMLPLERKRSFDFTVGTLAIDCFRVRQKYPKGSSLTTGNSPSIPQTFLAEKPRQPA